MHHYYCFLHTYFAGLPASQAASGCCVECCICGSCGCRKVAWDAGIIAGGAGNDAGLGRGIRCQHRCRHRTCS